MATDRSNCPEGGLPGRRAPGDDRRSFGPFGHRDRITLGSRQSPSGLCRGARRPPALALAHLCRASRPAGRHRDRRAWARGVRTRLVAGRQADRVREPESGRCALAHGRRWLERPSADEDAGPAGPSGTPNGRPTASGSLFLAGDDDAITTCGSSTPRGPTSGTSPTVRRTSRGPPGRLMAQGSPTFASRSLASATSSCRIQTDQSRSP